MNVTLAPDYKPSKIHIFLNGQLMTSGSSYDYELEGTSSSGITFKFNLEKGYYGYSEIYDYLRLLYARVGVAYSYNTGKRMISFTDDQIIDLIMKQMDGKL